MKKITSKKIPVWIAHSNGAALDLAARSYGLLAITRTFWRFGDFTGGHKSYAVTHVPTGYAIRDCLTWTVAKIVCEALVESGIPWRKVRLKNCQRYGKRVKVVLKTVGVSMAA